MVKRLFAAPIFALAITVFAFTGGATVSSAAGLAASATTATPAMPCAPNLQDPQCVLSGLSCHTRCAAPAWTAGAELASIPGDPCTRNWGEPVNTICHL